MEYGRTPCLEKAKFLSCPFAPFPFKVAPDLRTPIWDEEDLVMLAECMAHEFYKRSRVHGNVRD